MSTPEALDCLCWSRNTENTPEANKKHTTTTMITSGNDKPLYLPTVIALHSAYVMEEHRMITQHTTFVNECKLCDNSG